MSTSKRPTSHAFVALFLFLTGLFALLSACRTVSKASRLTILHTSDTWGYYDPCG